MKKANRVPENTYSLEHDWETLLTDLPALLPYLSKLGVDWLYLTYVNNYAAFAAVAAQIKSAGFGILLKHVPGGLGYESSIPEESFQAWVRDGVIDGVEIHHIDQLADPQGYVEYVQSLFPEGQGYVIADKILAPTEQLPTQWPVAGSTGYDVAAQFSRVVNGTVHHEGRDHALATYQGVLHKARRELAISGHLQSQLNELVQLCLSSGVDVEKEVLVEALAELAASLDVVRTYLPVGDAYLDEAFVESRERSGAMGLQDMNAVYSLLYPLLSDPANELAQQFQRFTSRVWRESAQLYVFYRYSLLASLNELGADPTRVSLTQEEFHQEQQKRQASWPSGLNSLTDTESLHHEDVRARINSLTQLPGGWRKRRTEVIAKLKEQGLNLQDDTLAFFILESVLGRLPSSRSELQRFATAAASSTGKHTSFFEPNDEYDNLVEDFVVELMGEGPTGIELIRILNSTEGYSMSHVLAQKVLQLTAPGVPNIYQGTEVTTWASLTVSQREEAIDQFKAGQVPLWDAAISDPDMGGLLKLLVTSRLLKLRRDEPERFTGYRPLTSTGTRKDCLLAYDRGGVIAAVTRGPGQVEAVGGWGNTQLMLGAGNYRDIISGKQLELGASVLATELFEHYPVAVLVKEN